MAMPALRERLRSRTARRWAATCLPLPQFDTDDRVLIIAPHSDDETLGCGGLIASLADVGVVVDIVVLTDGGASHSQLLSVAELVSWREKEAVLAAGKLGVEPDHVHFLRFPDGELQDHIRSAAGSLSALVDAVRPSVAFIPSHLDMQVDHLAGHAVSRAALSHAEATVYEFPVWEWYAWPWMSAPKLGWQRHQLRESIQFWARSIRRGGGARGPMYTHRLDIHRVLNTKRIALNEHRSQMQAFRPGWPTLSDVGRGTFLPNFFSGTEYFRLVVGPRPTVAGSHD